MVDINRRIKFTSDVTDAVTGIKRIEKAVADVSAEVKTAAKAQTVFVAELEKTRRSTAIEDLARDYAKLADETKDAEKAAANLLKRLNEIGASEDEIANAARSFSRFRGGGDRDLYRDSFGDISSATSALQSVGGGEASGLIADATGFIEYAPRLGESIADLAKRGVDSSGLLASAAGVLAPVMGAAAASITVMATAALPVVALLAGVAVAWNSLNKTIDEGKVQLKGAIDAQRNYYELLQSGTSDDAVKSIEQANKDLEALQARRAEILNAQNKGFEFAQSQYGDGLARLVISVGQGRGAFEDLDGELKDIDTQIAANEQTIKRLNTGLDNNAFATNDAATATEALNTSLDTLTAKQQQYEGALKASNQQIDSYTRQIKDLEDTLAQANTRESVVNIMQGVFDATEAAITATEKAEDAADAREGREDAHQARLAQIETQGNQTIEGLREAATQKAVDTQKSIDQLQADAQSNDEKALKAFHERIRKIEADARRKQEEALGAMSDARLRFDVEAFKKAQEAFDKADKQEDKGKRRATREFNDDKAERNRVLAEKIKALNEELMAFQAAQQTKIDAELKAINDRLFAEQVAFDESEKKLTEREDRLEQRANARAQRRADFDERLDNLRDGWELDDHNARIEQLREQRDVAQSNHDAALKNLTQTTGAIEKAKEATDALTESVNVLSEKAKWWETLPQPGVDFPITDPSTINKPGDYNTAPTSDEIGGGGTPDMMNPNFLAGSSRRPSFSNASAFVSGGRSGGSRGNATVQIFVSGNNFGKITTPEDVEAMAEKLSERIDTSQSETINGIKMSMRQAKRPVRS